VTFVCLAGETTVGNATSGGNAATGLMALKEHVENASASGNKRIAVAMVDPATPRSTSYVSDVLTAAGPLRSGSGRMVLVAARGATLDPTSTTATADAAAAVMGVIAGFPPGTSMVLKQVRGFTMPVTSQYTPAEITGLAGEGAIPLVDPALIPGSGLYLGDGGLFSSDAARNYVDLVTLLDQLEFVLRAGLIGTVGDTAITKPGLTSIRLRIEGIVAPFVASGALDSFDVTIPLLRILSVPAAARDAADTARLVTARQTRQVDAVLQAEISGTVHQIDLILKPHF
jgi:hypothetical protein